MKIAVHHTPDAHAYSWSRRWIPEIEKRGVDVLILDFHAPGIIEKVRGCDGAMWHWLHCVSKDKLAAPGILHAIEFGLRMPVFPNLSSRWHYNDKVAQYYLFQAINAPSIPSWVFWNYEEALDFVGQCAYPIILKLTIGAGSANVLKLDSRQQAEKILRKLFGGGLQPYKLNWFSRQPLRAKLRIKQFQLQDAYIRVVKGGVPQKRVPLPERYPRERNYAYFQQFLPGNPHDIRITVIGDRAFGFIRHNRPGDFRASGSGNWDVNPRNVPEEAVRIAHGISRANGFQSMAYDFLRSPDGKLLISEISYCYVNKAVYECPGHWDANLEWREGQMWPEEAQVEDFIEALREVHGQ